MTPVDAGTDWTINAPEEALHTPQSGVPWSLHRVTATVSNAFDRRIHADYLPPERIQMGSPVTGGQGKGAIMVEPWFNRLTRWIAPGSYGQQTVVLTPQQRT